MARTNIVTQDVNHDGVSVTYAAADAVNGMMFSNDGETVIHVKNGDASAHTVTVVSVPCSHGRTGNIAVSVPAGSDKMIGSFKPDLFNQKGANAGKVYVDFDADTSVTVAAIKL